MFSIIDKTVLITGAASGIGASVVRTLLDGKVKHVTILDIDDKHGLAIEEELNKKHGSNKVKFIKCDLTQEHELEDAFRTVKSEQGYIDVVINNAGIFNDKLYIKEIEVNVTAVVRSSIQAWDLMRKDEGGRGGTVINVSSITALTSIHVLPVYSATKSAIVKFGTTLGDEVHYERTNVRILSVCFGATDTKLLGSEKLGSFDPRIDELISTSFVNLTMQSTEQAAQGLMEVYKNGKSGSVWIVANGKPAIDVTDKYTRNCQEFDDIILN